MKSNAEVVYRDFDSSPALNSIIDKRLEKLSRYSDSIQHSRIVLDAPHNHKHKGKMFRASIEIDLKGTALLVSHDDESVHVALRDAFETMERRVKEESTKRRHTRH